MDNQSYIQNLQVNEVPWHRMPTAYGRGTDFPRYFKSLEDAQNKDEVMEASTYLASHMEHQGTLWYATPFALVFLTRIFRKAVANMSQNKIDEFVVVRLLDLFIEIANAVSDIELYPNTKELPSFKDMLKEEYLWSEVYDEEEDIKRYEEKGVFCEQLFYSFFYYSKQVLLTIRHLLKQLENGTYGKQSQSLQKSLHM